MHGRLAGLDEGETVMARIDVQKPRLERMRVIVGEPEAQQFAIERHHLIDGLDAIDVEDDMPETERSGPESRDWAAWHEWIGCNLSAVENLELVAERIVDDDQVLHQALVGERA